MKSRPISSLVEALRSLGVSIEYTEKEGYPPVLLTVNAVNRQWSTDNSQQTLSTTLHPTLSTLNSLEISAEQSSQFASSLLLAAPLWKNGLVLHLTGNLSSLPYIDMTINMMRQCGIDVSRDDRDITVKPGVYNVENIKVEPDWSAAAFWYEMVSLSDGAEVLLKNLNINSLQADATAIKMFENLGVETIAAKDGVVVKKVNSQQSMANSQSSTFNFKDCPDLFPAVIAACAGNRVNATFTGLKNLSIKESDRKQAMMNELMKINITFENVSDDVLKMFCPNELPCFTEEKPIIFNNYEDHRIAMALSVLSMKIGVISMENDEVVSKSYPGFFDFL
jgi:3-phosphoshikimate 1-carboxyvinyltransferase